MLNNEPSSYETFQHIATVAPDQRYKLSSLTGEGPEADFAKLVRAGTIQGHVDDPQEWRTAIRKYARRMKVKLRTYDTGGFVIAMTAGFEQWLRTKRDDPEETRAALAIIRDAFEAHDRQERES
jgi:hypothetical protein